MRLGRAAGSAGCAAFTIFQDMARQKAIFPRDAGLQTRMLLTLFLLGLLYVAFIGVLAAAGAGVVAIVVVMGALSLAQLLFSDKLALAAMGAKEVSPEQAPGLHAMIERLCIQADLPKPKIAVADSPVPNAFALGRSQKSATVCATTGIMSVLSPSELEGVMAHELAHIKHRDVLIMTIASFFASIAAIILQFGFFFGGGDDEDDHRARAGGEQHADQGHVEEAQQKHGEEHPELESGVATDLYALTCHLQETL